jgi:hypothetical protein
MAEVEETDIDVPWWWGVIALAILGTIIALGALALEGSW